MLLRGTRYAVWHAASRTLGSGSGGGIALSGTASIAEDIAADEVVGAFTTTNTTGTPTFTLDNDASGLFALDGDNLITVGPFDYETASSHLIVVSVTGVDPGIIPVPFIITVTDVATDTPVNTEAPAITGTAEVTNILTASTGTWTGDPTPTYTYQWKADDVAIDGATDSTYQLTQAEDGAAITVTVTATNTAGAVPATSAATAAVSSFSPALQFDDARNSQYAFLGWM